MGEISRYLFLAGALPFLVLGVAHALATPLHPAQSRGLSPRDPAVRDAMQRDFIMLTRRTNVWLAWVGFNLSHSLGAVLFGAFVVLIARSQATFEAQATLFLPLAVLVSGLYLALAIRFWFRTPIIGVALSSVCFVGSWALFLLRG
jgi:hypothetical protein